MTLRIPRLIQDYCEAFAEYRKRTGYTPYSTRLAFDMMDDSTIGYAVEKAKKAIFNEYGTVNDEGELFLVGKSVAIVVPMTEDTLSEIKRLAVLSAQTLPEYTKDAILDRMREDQTRYGSQ